GNELTAAAWPVLAEAAGSVATARIRRAVTLGGNVVPGDPAHDPPAALLAVGAVAEVASATGTRRAPVAGLTVAPDELVVAFELPNRLPRTGSAYLKHLVRGVWEYASVGVAAVVRLDGDGALEHLAVALGSAAPSTRAVHTDEFAGMRPTGDVVAAIAAKAAAASDPWTDVRGSAAYKRRMVEEFTRRAVHEALNRTKETPQS
ncbi:MAG: FAD binding domain-containing protein, partial [Streptosporangiales bacterium]|nr:FAD binding domain-containing protein [Streptosporangiales bacterium]